jgi:hypothetical protein
VHVVATSKGAALEGLVMPRIASTYADLKQSVDPGTWAIVLEGLQQISQLEDRSSRHKPAMRQ